MFDQSIIYNQINNINPIGEISIIIIVAVTSIFLAFNENIEKKDYQKKYILVCYFMLYILLLTLQLPLKYIIGIFSLILLPLSGINSAYQSDHLEKELGGPRLILYKSLQWIFMIKFYLFYICFSFIYISHILLAYILKVQYLTIELTMHTLIIVGFLFYHLSSNITDKFGVISFDELKNNIHTNVNSFDSNDIDEVLTLIGFVIFTEDKDYFNRKSPIYSIFSVIKRKLSQNLNQSMSPNTKGSLFFLPSKKFLLFIKELSTKKIKRGYSTLDGQYIRVNALYPDSFQYKVRRKLFVEYIYTPAFYKAWMKALKRHNHSKNNSKWINYIKLSVLKSYFVNNKILKNPTNKDELFRNFQSSLNLKSYNYLWKIYLNQHDLIVTDLKKRFVEINNINRGEEI